MGEIKLISAKLLDAKFAEEKEFVRTFCIGSVHPDQTNQKEFTKWLQDVVLFHLNDFKKKLATASRGRRENEHRNR